MGYRKMNVEELYEIFRRWHNNQTISRIAVLEGRDRKTVRNYINIFKKSKYYQGCSLPEKSIIIKFLKTLIPKTEKKSFTREQLSIHLDELKELVNDPKEPVKPKTAWEIITTKYNLQVSYESFKVFVRKNPIKLKQNKNSIIRIELPPGQETQIDYGKVGYLKDLKTDKNKTTYAFCGILSNSRLPFIEFCYSQNNESFVESHVNMFEFYEGITDFISLDNLKSGVIKPDLYDPKINKAYQEMADYYGVFIDPCRVAKPTDKGKIERLVPVARELFRKLKNIHPTADLVILNKKAKKWCIEEYGNREHGTTKIAPFLAYQAEKKYLKKLSEERFIIPFWKKARVHPDQFFSFDKKRYSLPSKYKSREIWVKRVKNMIYVYFNYECIRTYVIPKNHITYIKEDFPKILREMLDGGYPRYLLNESKKLGDCAYKLLDNILKPHAYLNARRAQGVLEVLKKYYNFEYFNEVCESALTKNIVIPKVLKILFEEAKSQKELNFDFSYSPRQKEMIRDADYYWQ